MDGLNAPLVLQCRGCRRVISDSNQLIGALESLDGLILDAVLGVHIGTDELHSEDGVDAGCTFVALSCTECHKELGRCYSRAPPELQPAVQEGQPRYVLHRRALQSYVLGSTKAQHDAAIGPVSSPAQAAGPGSCVSCAAGEPAGLHAELEAVKARLSQLEGGAASMQLTQHRVLETMHVLLSLNERLERLERGSPPGEAKRQRSGESQ